MGRGGIDAVQLELQTAEIIKWQIYVMIESGSFLGCEKRIDAALKILHKLKTKVYTQGKYKLNLGQTLRVPTLLPETI